MYQSPYFFLLESSLGGPQGQYTIAAWDPVEIYRFNGGPGEADPFAFLGNNTPCPPLTLRGGIPRLPFNGGWIGYLGYELYNLLESKIPSRQSRLIPAAVFARYENFYVYDHFEKKGWTVGATPRGCPLFAATATHEPGGHVGPPLRQGPRDIQSNFTRLEYIAAVQKIKRYIAAGDVYQVNLSQRWTTSTTRSSYDLYQQLRQTSPAPYAAYLNLGEAQIISASPECFLHVGAPLGAPPDDRRDRAQHPPEADQPLVGAAPLQVTTRPIKGTRPRGNTPEADARFKEELYTSAKDRAELLMIVDLERNDLGKVCQTGSVQVATPVAQVESYPQVHHLVATVQGTLREDCSIEDVLRATFPGGSITGAPKVRAMQIIRELEPTAREVYTGAIGFVDQAGQAHFNVAIRTLVVKDGFVHWWAGGGIVADSDPEQEYEETLVKAKGIVESL